MDAEFEDLVRKRRLPVLFAIVIAAWSIVPIYWVVNLSLQFDIPPSLFPFHPYIAGYLDVISSLTSLNPGFVGYQIGFGAGVADSLFVATMVMIFTMVLSIPFGYGLARYSFPARTALFLLIILCRAIPPISILAPLYALYKIVNLGGTFQGIILAHMTLTVPLIAWVTAGIFSSIPRDLDKQARVDGCSRVSCVFRVVVPAAAPGLAVVAVLAWLTSWNEFILALFLGDAKGLRLVGPSVNASGPETLVVSLIPPIIAAIVLARFMTRLKIIAPPSATSDYGT